MCHAGWAAPQRGAAIVGLVWRYRARLVPASAVIAVASVVWFALSVAGVVPPRWGLVLVIPATALASLACLAAASPAQLPAAARRFWRGMALGELLVGVGMAIRTCRTLGNADSTRVGVNLVELTVLVSAIIVMGWALIRLPMGLRSRTQRWAFALDVCTVLAAATVFWWQFVYRPLAGRAGDHGVISAVVSEAVCMAAVFALVKVALVGRHTVDSGALRLLGSAMLFAMVFSAPDNYLAEHSQLTASQVVLPIAIWLTTLATRRQWRAATAQAAPVRGRPRRAFSLLPYVAVAGTDALLLAAADGGRPAEHRMIAFGVVVVTMLVVVRQIMTFRENGRLVERLDAGMVELRDHERRFRSLIQHSSDLITITSSEAVLTYVSPGIAQLGRSVEDMLGKPAAALVHPDDLEMAYRHYQSIADQPGATTTYQVRLSHADGSWRWMEITTSNLMHEPGVAGIVGNARDVTQARELQQRLSHEASHDALTQLANRSLFAERLQTALDTAPDAGLVGVILVDLNEFKAVNDSLGHAVGDALLVATAQRLCELAPPGATAARLGGDEFALLLAVSNEDALTAIADGLVRAFDAAVPIGDRELRMAASIGYAANGDGGSPDELLRRADVAMYAAKAGGERRYTRVACYTASMDQAFTAQTDLERDLRGAIDRGDLHLVYQPIVDLADGTIVGAEALLRWTHPDRGPVPPAQFIPIAERTGLIVPLGAWVLREACGQAALWHRQYGRHAPAVSVNVSPRQLREPALSSQIAATLVEAGLPPNRLTVEVTESMVLDDHASHATLETIHRLGVRISLDDFGTGQSALTVLDRCPIDEVKLDRSFTQACTVADRSRVPAAVIQLARTLGVNAVAEGVESDAQAAALSALGYQHAQGYYFATPLPGAEFDARLADTAGIRVGLISSR